MANKLFEISDTRLPYKEFFGLKIINTLNIKKLESPRNTLQILDLGHQLSDFTQTDLLPLKRLI